MASRVHTRFYQVPAYPLYQLEAAYFGATFVPIEVEPGHAAPTPDALAAAFREQRHLGRRVRALVLCTPNNPTGATLRSGEATALAAALEAELVQGAGFVVLLDEVYIGIESTRHVSLLTAASPALAVPRLCPWM